VSHELCVKCRSRTDRNPAPPLVLSHADAGALNRLWKVGAWKGAVFCGPGCLLWWITHLLQARIMEQHRRFLQGEPLEGKEHSNV